MNRIEQVSRVGESNVLPNEAPHFETSMDGGYFQLSHSVFRDPKLRELPGDTFRLYLWLSTQGWRFRCKISPQRSHSISNVRDHAISRKRSHSISSEWSHLTSQCA